MTAKRPLVFAFAFVLLVFSAALAVKPRRSFSSFENKYLSERPVPTASLISHGGYAPKYEGYLSEQFPLRELFVRGKAVCETLLLKTENNGVVFGRDGYAFQKFYRFDTSVLRDNLAAIDAFAASCPCEAYVMLVPSGSYSLSGFLPDGLPYVSQRYFIAAAERFLSTNARPVNVKDILSANDDKYIFYRSDSRWTSYGAYLAYTQFAAEKNYTPLDCSSVKHESSDGFLGSYYRRSMHPFASADTVTAYDIPCVLEIDSAIYGCLYDRAALLGEDKYSAFLHGNHAVTNISSRVCKGNGLSLLIIKDSYANCLVQFFVNDYENITVLDARHFSGDFSSFFSHGYDDVLIVYGFENLVSDPNVAKLLL